MKKGVSSSTQRGRGRSVSPSVSKFSYDLFELAHILRVRPRASLQPQKQSGGTSTCKYEGIDVLLLIV